MRGRVFTAAALSGFAAVVAQVPFAGVVRAAAPEVTGTAQGVRIGLTLQSAIPLSIVSRSTSWVRGDDAESHDDTGLTLGVPITGPSLVSVGSAAAVSEPSGGGVRSGSRVAAVRLLGDAGSGTVTADRVESTCTMNGSTISGGSTVAGLRIGNATVLADANVAVGVPGVLSGHVDRRLASYDTASGRLTYTVRGVDAGLLGGALGIVGSGSVVLAEAVCAGTVRIGAPTTDPVTVVPGATATATITVANTGAVAAPGTVIRVPMPGAGLRLGTATTTGGGTCAPSGVVLQCTGVTVPGGGSIVLGLPVTASASATAGDTWAAAAGDVEVRSDPIPAATGDELTATGSGALAIVLARGGGPAPGAVTGTAAAWSRDLSRSP